MARTADTTSLIGRRIGRLTVLECVGKDKHNQTRWRCSCDCGNETVISRVSVINGRTKSCGCLQKEHQSNWNGISNKGRRLNGAIARIIRDDWQWKGVCESAGLTIEERRSLEKVREVILRTAKEAI